MTEGGREEWERSGEKESETERGIGTDRGREKKRGEKEINREEEELNDVIVYIIYYHIVKIMLLIT